MNATGIVITHVPRKFYDVSSGISVGWDGQLGGARPAGPARSTTGALLLLMQPAPTNVCCASRVIYALAQLGRYTISDLIELGILCVEVPSIGGPP